MSDLNQEKNSANDIFSGKNCLITGSTGGLGKEIAKLLAKKNCNLFLLNLFLIYIWSSFRGLTFLSPDNRPGLEFWMENLRSLNSRNM